MTEQDGWMELDAYCEKYGERANTVHKRVTAGQWQRGVEISTPDGGVSFVNIARAEEWLAKRGKLRL